MAARLAERTSVPLRIEHDGRTLFCPISLEQAIEFLLQNPGALIVSGGTETGLTRNRTGTQPRALLSLERIGELRQITCEEGVLSIGASVTWTELEEFSRGRLPLVHTLTERFGSPQIRNAGTLVGNIAHGSPVADSLCFLLIAGAELELAGTGGRRRGTR